MTGVKLVFKGTTKKGNLKSNSFEFLEKLAISMFPELADWKFEFTYDDEGDTILVSEDSDVETMIECSGPSVKITVNLVKKLEKSSKENSFPLVIPGSPEIKKEIQIDSPETREKAEPNQLKEESKSKEENSGVEDERKNHEKLNSEPQNEPEIPGLEEKSIQMNEGAPENKEQWSDLSKEETVENKEEPEENKEVEVVDSEEEKEKEIGCYPQLNSKEVSSAKKEEEESSPSSAPQLYPDNSKGLENSFYEKPKEEPMMVSDIIPNKVQIPNENQALYDSNPNEPVIPSEPAALKQAEKSVSEEETQRIRILISNLLRSLIPKEHALAVRKELLRFFEENPRAFTEKSGDEKYRMVLLESKMMIKGEIDKEREELLELQNKIKSLKEKKVAYHEAIAARIELKEYLGNRNAPVIKGIELARDFLRARKRQEPFGEETLKFLRASFEKEPDLYSELPHVRRAYLRIKKEIHYVEGNENINFMKDYDPENLVFGARKHESVEEIVKKHIEQQWDELQRAMAAGNAILSKPVLHGNDGYKTELLQLAQEFARGPEIPIEELSGNICAEISTHQPKGGPHASRFVFKTLLVENDGNAHWDMNCSIGNTIEWGDVLLERLPPLAPGERGVVTMTLKNQKAVSFSAEIGFFYGLKPFGKKVRVIVQKNQVEDLNFPDENQDPLKLDPNQNRPNDTIKPPPANPNQPPIPPNWPDKNQNAGFGLSPAQIEIVNQIVEVFGTDRLKTIDYVKKNAKFTLQMIMDNLMLDERYINALK